MDHQGPTPIGTPTFLEKQKSEVAKMNDDDKDNEIVFKQPISGEKKNTRDSATYKFKEKKMKKKQSVILNVLCIVLLKRLFYYAD